MRAHEESLKSPPILLGREEMGVKEALQKHSRTNFMRCLQCRSCSSGCPFYSAMDLGPNRVIRLLQLEQFQQALESTTIWVCVGCDTCAANCPMAIEIPSVMDVLRQYALDTDCTISMPEILNLHNEILDSIKRYGRTHKLEIMLRYKVKKRAWLEDMDVGLKMLTKRKLHVLPSKVQSISEIKDMFQTARPVTWPAEGDYEK
ncbi:MAG: 4Fe-4S dicluster domain-containing protein [Desulfovermiculus sp.]|nr:4Fe-4S dicluster domain-containing protein [Desulfovermiculus sp.]